MKFHRKNMDKSSSSQSAFDFGGVIQHSGLLDQSLINSQHERSDLFIEELRSQSGKQSA